jgi:hypothetical protein
MDPEGSSPYSQEPTTGLYSEPDESSPLSHPTSLKSILILFHIRLGFSSGLLPSGLPNKIICAFLISPGCATCLISNYLLP